MIKKSYIEENIGIILENIYLVVMAFWIGFFFLSTTTFENVCNDNFYNIIRNFMIILILLRAFSSKKSTLREVLLIFLLCSVFLIAGQKNEHIILENVLLVILGAREISFRKIVKVYLFVLSGLLCITIFMALTGHIENLVFYQDGRRPRISFGIGYPTDFSAYVFYLLLAYFYLRGKQIKYIELGLSAVIAALVYWFCDARLNTICIFLMIFVFGYHKIMSRKAERRQKVYAMNSVWSSLLAISPIICGLTMTVLSLFYNPNIKIFNMLNKALNNRLLFGNKGIVVYSYSMWGKYIPMQGNGRTTKEVLHYFFIDSSYISIGLQYGILVLATVLLIWLLIGKKAQDEKNWELLWILALVGIQCIVEHHMLEVPYSLFLWALLADTKDKSEVKQAVKRYKL